jgi:ubiquinone biosynthesis protein
MTDSWLAARAIARAKESPAGLARLLRRLGPGFVRYGQLLALRADLVPPEFREELLLESSDVSQSWPWSDVRAFLSAELGGIDTVFRSIDPLPAFFNGISQAHAAVTSGGQSVLIKFVLPDAPGLVRRDGRRARAFARLAPSARPLVEELIVLADREVDLIRERENIGKLAATTEINDCLCVPRVFPELCTARVLTRENLGGLPLTAVLSPARRAALKMEGSDFYAPALAAGLVGGAARQALERHFYCSDVRPANLLLLPGNRFSFVHFNHCETVDRENALRYTRFLNDVFSVELPRMARGFEELLTATNSSASVKMREEFIRESHEWLRSAPPAHRIRSAADFSSPLSKWLAAILSAARRNGFEIPFEMLTVFRTLMSVESVAMRLDPSVHLQSAGAETLKDIVLNDVFDRIEPVKIRGAMVNLLSALNNAPQYLHQILTDSAQGRLGVGLNATEHPHSAATRDRRYRLIAVALAAVGVAWLMGEPGLPVPASRALIGVLAALYLFMIVLWRRLD